MAYGLVPNGSGDAVQDSADIKASVNQGLGGDCREIVLVEAAVGNNMFRWLGAYYARFNVEKVLTCSLLWIL